ncbi:MAG: DUF2982 domain-containing protein [Gammaproteobacteria bacterium]|jgi:hypothetical protein|nr:DUF2982 domain-containing protein [Gammaproteobacteria bacterium]
MRYLYRSRSGQGGGALLLSSALVFVILILLLAIAPHLTSMQGWVLLFLLLSLAIFVGYSKMTEPYYAVELNEQGVCYHHRRGSWLLPWQAFSFASVPQLNQVGELSFVSFKVTHYPAFLANLPLRLAVKLLIEQRSLLIAALRQNCPTGTCPSEMILESGDFYVGAVRYHGVLAMFAHRMRHLSVLLGAELFIPAECLPLAPADFCRVVNRSRLIYMNNTEQLFTGQLLQ